MGEGEAGCACSLRGRGLGRGDGVESMVKGMTRSAQGLYVLHLWVAFGE